MIFCFCFLQFLVFSLFAIDFAPNSAKNGILIDANRGSVLYEMRADERVFPASLTKVAVVLFVLENFREQLSLTLIAKKEMLDIYHPYEKRVMLQSLPTYILETDGIMIDLRSEEQMSLYCLLEAMMIRSANDAANVVAGSLGSSIEDFMSKLNHYLKEIGCRDTQFLNPHGLHHPEHYSTARDLALITKRALKDPLFRKIVGKTKFYRPETNLQRAKTLLTGNRLLKKGRYYYSKAIGIKTGYTSKAGNCLITTAQDKAKEYIAVLLGYDDPITRYVDAIALMEKVFHTKPIPKILLQAGLLEKEISLEGAKKQIHGYIKQPLTLSLFPNEKLTYRIDYEIDAPLLPIQKNDQIGKVQVFSDSGDLIATLPIFAAEGVLESFFHKLLRMGEIVVKKIAMHTNVWGVALLFLLGLILGGGRFLRRQQ